jgi:type VI secretion system protein ImpH
MASVLEQISRFNFYQFCQLLETASPHTAVFGSQDGTEKDPIRFRSRPGFGFPATELSYQADRFEDQHLPVPAVFTSFLGLTGVDGILPHHVGNDLVTRREGHEVLSDFLDLFHHRIITRYYAIWRKYHYPSGFQPGGHDQVSRALLGLAGRALSQAEHGLASSRWLALLGPLSRRSRTADGLRAAVRHVLPELDVAVEEFAGQCIFLSAPPLGRQTCMSAGQQVLGRRIVDVQRSVKLTLLLQQGTQLAALQTGTQTHGDLSAVIRGYLGLRWDVLLFARLPQNQLPPSRLSRQGARMGREAHTRFSSVITSPDTIHIPLGKLHA